MKKKTFLIQVVPLVRMAISRDPVFSYIHTAKLLTGTLVKVPLGKNRTVLGIIIGTKAFVSENSLPQEIKSIYEVLPTPPLTQNQIRLAEWVTHVYFISLGMTLRMFLPPDFKKRKFSQKKSKKTIEKILLTDMQKKISEEIFYSKKSVFFTGPPSSGKTEVLINIVSQILDKKKQVLFLLPEIALTPHTTERLEKRLGHSAVTLFHSALTPKNRSEAWQRVASGNPCVVVGSRGALFLPFQKLGLVIVDEEHDDSYKQTLKSPRYDARTVAKQLSFFHKTKIILSSATPRGETWFETEKKTLQKISLPSLPVRVQNFASRQIETQNNEPMQISEPSKTQSMQTKNLISPQVLVPRVCVVNMRLAHWKNAQKKKIPPILSDELIEMLFQTIREKKQALLLVSRQGMNAFTLCATCKNIFRCPKCDRALVAQRSGHFLCLGGHFRTQAFPKCPTCGGLHFIGHGIGTQKVEEEVRKRFQYAHIARLDSQSFKKRAFRETVFRDMTRKKIDILIGTQMIAKGWDIPHLTLIGVIDTDSFFSFPDFSTDLRTTQLLFQARGRLGRVGNTQSGTLLLQTYHSDRPTFSALEKNDYLNFLKTELETRESLKYPPYCTLLRIAGKDTDENALRTQGLALFKALSKTANTSLFISRPAKSLKRQKIGWFCRHIIIKIFKPDIPPATREILENLPKNWYVDREPVSLS